MNNDIKEILFTKNEIDKMVVKIGKQISDDYKGKDLMLVCVLKGANMFMSDLMKAIDIPVEIDFISASSYGHSTISSGVVKFLKDVDSSVENKHIILVEDLVDTGLTLKYLLKNFRNRDAVSVEACTLLDKPERRTADVLVKYKGFNIPDEFIVGYGIDYAEKYRNLPYIATLKPEVYGE
ncbi:hypoxanthine phosphoribosyltransferase [Clostridiaceae bacterium HSG29]|nr:hypoxanthine phosphoribosyltransferase [Clostridiaceae bacterium HSG29]